MTLYEAALAELAGIFRRIDEARVDEMVEKIAGSRRIVTLGCGREKLQIMGFAMRLFHMGRNVAVAGDMTTPPVGPGDLLLVTNGPGELPSVEALMRIARDAGAFVILITAERVSPAALLADMVLVLEAQTMASDDRRPYIRSPMGSAYEGALFVLFEILVLKLVARLSISFEDMRRNHTNLE